MTRSTMLFALSGTLAVAACADPAADKVKAKVEAVETPDAAPKAAAPAKAGEAFTLQADSSKLGFIGSKVTGSHTGGFRAFTANAQLADGKIEGGSVNVEIDTTSIFTDADKLTGHLVSQDFFNVEKYPKATFASTNVKAGGERSYSHTVEGNLTLCGITKKVTFPATIAMNDGKIDVDTEFAINRKEFGMEYPGKPDDLIRDDVVINLDLTLAAAQKADAGA